MHQYLKKFISIDLETTDLKDGRIMEVGAIEVELKWNEQGKKIEASFGRSFETLINPEVEVPRTALAITGITQEELKSAPLWKDTLPLVKDFLAENLLAGHNVEFDLQFLKDQGLKLKNQYVDTLEMAQTILPLSESHSLEFLVGYFNLPSKRSHRAIDDSKSAGYLMERILNEFLTFPLDLQKQIKSRVSDSLPRFRDIFADLPEIAVKKKQTSPVSTDVPVAVEGSNQPIEWTDSTILSLPLSFNKQEEWLQRLARSSEKAVIGLSHEVYLNFVPENQKITHPGQALCEKRLNWLEGRDKLSETAGKVLIKTLILREKTASLDISSVRWTAPEREILGIVTCEPNVCEKHQCLYARSLKLAGNKPYFAKSSAIFDLASNWGVSFSSHRLLLFDLAAVEDSFTESLKRIWNLNKIRRAIQIVYPINPAAPSFYSDLSREVETVANDLDLFFGILHLVYRKKENEFSENIIIDAQERDGGRFTKLLHPAEKLAVKLEKFSQFLESRKLAEERDLIAELENLRIKILAIKQFLDEFFGLSLHPQNICWLKFDSEIVDLNIVPRDLSSHWMEFQKRFKGTSIVDTLLPKMSLAYFQKRLGLQNFEVERIEKPKQSGPVKINIASKQVLSKELESFLGGLKPPAVIITPNETKLSEIFETFSKSVEPDRLVLAYKYSGSLSVLKARLAAASRNEKTDLILILTTSAFFRFFSYLPKALNLVILRLPFEAPGTKPAILSAGSYENFSDHILPRAVHQLHLMLSRFASAPGTPKTVYILDPRILTDYNQEFIKYLQEFPDFEISTVNLG
ncbi:MAG: exonuclease domain-containing protein [Candidatus Doudnabacteria bacterium]|nr:exonuclease domain-containing protein [Candidatus Doudnabacteria bacterium]